MKKLLLTRALGRVGVSLLKLFRIFRPRFLKLILDLTSREAIGRSQLILMPVYIDYRGHANLMKTCKRIPSEICLRQSFVK